MQKQAQIKFVIRRTDGSFLVKLNKSMCIMTWTNDKQFAKTFALKSACHFVETYADAGFGMLSSDVDIIELD
jgi:hypothetical protein